MKYLHRLFISAIIVFHSQSFAITCTDLDGASVRAQDFNGTYLGFFGTNFAPESINNTFGSYGSSFSVSSVRYPSGQYGSAIGPYSAYNNLTNTPPEIYKGATLLGYLTTNSLIALGVSLDAIDSVCTFTATAPSTNNPALFSNAGYSGNLTAGSTISVSVEVSDLDGTTNLLSNGLYGFAIRNADGTLYDSVWVNASSAELELTSEYVGKSIVFLLDFLDDLGNQETSTFYDIGEVVEDPEENNAVNVPAMGGIGLLALGLSILGLGAVSLRKK